MMMLPKKREQRTFSFLLLDGTLQKLEQAMIMAIS